VPKPSAASKGHLPTLFRFELSFEFSLLPSIFRVFAIFLRFNPGATRPRVCFWAVVSGEINRVIEFFPTRWQAERMLAKALWDKPAWQGLLRVEKIEFRTGTAN
jgi:hypothetical protein